MDLFFTMLVPLTIAGVALYAAFQRVDVYSALVRGAGSGLETLVRIVPALVGLMTAVYMLRASGALELLAGVLAPVLDRLGLPSELLPLMLVAGDHARNDMAVDWKESLEQAGHSVQCAFTGLGELSWVQEMYKERLLQVL